VANVVIDELVEIIAVKVNWTPPWVTEAIREAAGGSDGSFPPVPAFSRISSKQLNTWPYAQRLDKVVKLFWFFFQSIDRCRHDGNYIVLEQREIASNCQDQHLSPGMEPVAFPCASLIPNELCHPA
jgi:hypothetical protein